MIVIIIIITTTELIRKILKYLNMPKRIHSKSLDHIANNNNNNINNNNNNLNKNF